MRPCKLYSILNQEGEEVVTVKRVNVNAKLPVESTEGAAGYDLAASHDAVVLVHGKCLVKTGLQMALPLGCYGRIAPQSGLALKKFIDIGPVLLTPIIEVKWGQSYSIFLIKILWLIWGIGSPRLYVKK